MSAGETKPPAGGTKPASSETGKPAGETKPQAAETPKPRGAGAVARDLHDRMRKPALDQRDAEDGGRPPGACFCGSCPCSGGYDVGMTGRFYCQWHAYAMPDQWGEISAELQRHRWLLDFMNEAVRLFRAGQDAAWLARADSFFEHRPELKPSAHERANFAVYLWRLQNTLGFYVGIRKDMPEPRQPQALQKEWAQKPRGGRASDLLAELEEAQR